MEPPRRELKTTARFRLPRPALKAAAVWAAGQEFRQDIILIIPTFIVKGMPRKTANPLRDISCALPRDVL